MSPIDFATELRASSAFCGRIRTISREALAKWAGHEAFLGLRLPLVVMEDPTWIGGGTANAALSEIARRGLVAQVLAGPEHLRHCTTALEKHPELIAVLDHAANPPVQSGEFEPWAHLIGRFAASTSAWCKISDFHQAGGPPLTDEQILPYLDHVISVFGSERIIAGSNWPVSSLHESYGTTFHRLDRMMRRLGLETKRREAIFHGNAARLIAAVRRRMAREAFSGEVAPVHRRTCGQGDRIRCCSGHLRAGAEGPAGRVSPT